MNHNLTTKYLPLLITLGTELLLQVPLDANRRDTARVIPGRTLQGLLAFALRDKPDELISQAVRGQGVSVGPAYPVTDNGQVALPTPASWAEMTELYDDGGESTSLVDILNTATEISGSLSSIEPLVSVTTSAATAHQVRTVTTPRGGTTSAKTRTVSDESGPFTDTLIAAHQRFVTVWRLRYDAKDPSKLDELLELISKSVCAASANGRFRLGGSGGAAGGAPRITSLDGQTTLEERHLIEPGDAIYYDNAGAPRTQNAQDWPRGTARTVLITSPVVSNSAGANPNSLGAELAEALRLAVGDDAPVVEVRGQWVDPVRYGGYNRLYAGFVAEAWAAGAGSVVRMEATRDMSADEINAWVGAGLGTRQAEGCGRFVLVPDHTRSYEKKASAPQKSALVDGHGQNVEPLLGGSGAGGAGESDAVLLCAISELVVGSGAPQTPVALLQNRLFRDIATDEARNLGHRWKGPRSVAEGPSSHLWSRLLDQLLAERANAASDEECLGEFAKYLNERLAKPARTKLQAGLEAPSKIDPLPERKNATVKGQLIAATSATKAQEQTDGQEEPQDTGKPALQHFLEPLLKPLAERALKGWYAKKPDGSKVELTAEDVAREWLTANRFEFAYEALVAHLRAQRSRARKTAEATAQEEIAE